MSGPSKTVGVQFAVLNSTQRRWRSRCTGNVSFRNSWSLQCGVQRGT